MIFCVWSVLIVKMVNLGYWFDYKVIVVNYFDIVGGGMLWILYSDDFVLVSDFVMKFLYI